MKLTGGQIVVRALEDEGVPFAFGIPGTHNIELYDGLAASRAVRPVLVTDEQAASFMADAVWRASGRLGCVNVVPGAGLTHALSGIAEAYLDNVAMLVLGCGIRRDTGRGYQLHDVDQLALVAPVTKARLRPEVGGDIYATVRRACRLAREGAPGPVFVEIPADLYLFRHEFDRRAGAPIHGGPAAAPAPAAPEVERAAALLGGSRRPLLYLGLGAAGAGRELVRLAERLEAAVATTIQGKGVFPESHPLFLWPGFGDAAPAFVREIVGGCDATLAIGCRFGEVATGSYGLVPPAPLIHVDIDPAVIGRNYPVELGIVADAGLFVGALLERLEVGLGPKPETSERAGRGAGRGAVKGRRPGAEAVWLGDVVAGAADKAGTGSGSGSGSDLRRRTPDRAMRERIQQGHEEVWAEWLGEKAERRVSPARLMRGLQEHFGADAIFTTDSGNGTFLATELLRLDRPGKLLAPVDYSCMGYAVPAAVGAKLACSEAPVIALAGDGAFLMTGLELLTAAHHSVAIAVLVLRDRELAQIAQFQSVALNRKACSELADYDLAGLSRAVGVECLPLDRDEEIPAALAEVERILAGGRPVVVDVAIDYSRKTYFTRGVVKTNLLRLPWPDRLRFIGRALGRRLRA